MKNEVKWIICDLDGTLLRYENPVHVIEDEAVQAIDKAIKANKIFTVATGRKYTDALKIYNSYDILKNNCRYIVACNGSIIYDTKEQKMIQAIYMDSQRLKLCEQILEYLRSKDYELILGSYRSNNSIVFNNEAKIHRTLVNNFLTYEGDFTEKVIDMTCDFSQEKDLLKMIFYFEGYFNKYSMHDILEDIVTKFNIDRNEMMITSPISIEFNPAGVSKGAAIKQLSKILNISVDNALSIGDSGNDISMFQTTKYSATLASSAPEVKEHATHIFDAKASFIVAKAINELVND